MRKKIIRIFGALVTTAILMSSFSTYEIDRVSAVEFTVTESKAVLYSNDNTKVYKQPDVSSGVVTVIAKDLPVSVTGVTSNGWFRVSLNGTYYIPGDGLVSKTETTNTVSSSDIEKLTKGTFSFYKSSELSKMDKDDVEDMDENTYIKYLDSFIMGYAKLDYCILQDSGKYLKDVYESKSKTDTSVAAMSMQSYLIYYRNNYLSDSIIGPYRTEKDLKLVINRAIRYDIEKFNTVYKNSSVGTDESKLDKAVEKVIKEIKAEQGVTFTYSAVYGNYKTSDGSEGKGWIVELTKKD